MAMDINDVLFIASKAPCSFKLTEIIKNEVECGNIITSFDKVTSLPDETYYIMVFRDMPKENYSSIKICHVSIASMTGWNLAPISVSEYSTRGGIASY